MTRHRRRSSRSPYGLGKVEQWVFADPMPERLRFEIDRRWYGELPRTHFYDRTSPDRRCFRRCARSSVCGSGFARTRSPAATGEGCTSRRSRQAVSDQDDEVLPLPVSSHCMSCWSHCSAVRPCVRRFHSPCARWQCACLNRSSRRLRPGARKTATIDTESAPRHHHRWWLCQNAPKPASFAVPAQAAPVSASSTLRTWQSPRR